MTIEQYQVAKALYPSIVGMDGDVFIDVNEDEVTVDMISIDAELTRLQELYVSQEYARLRKAEYDKLNQFEMQFDDNRDGTTTWPDAINEIKMRYPK